MSETKKQDEKLLLTKALKHYSNKLRDLTADEDIRYGNHLLNSDLNTISNQINETLKFLMIDNFYMQLFIRDYGQLVSDALACYIFDLEHTKKKVWEKLGAKPELQNLDSEIKMAKSFANNYNLVAA